MRKCRPCQPWSCREGQGSTVSVCPGSGWGRERSGSVCSWRTDALWTPDYWQAGLCSSLEAGHALMAMCRSPSRLAQMVLSLRSANYAVSRQWDGSTINLLPWQPWSCRRRVLILLPGSDFSPVVQWPSSLCVSPTPPHPTHSPPVTCPRAPPTAV